MKKFKTLIILGAALLVLAAMFNWFFQDEIEIRAAAPIPVYLTEGWPMAHGNAVIGTLPVGTTIDATKVVDKDHMVYRIEYSFSPGKKQVGYVMYNGACDKDLVEIQIRHHLFQGSEKLELNCKK